jgi:Carboxypeptidase regulatory-like domain
MEPQRRSGRRRGLTAVIQKVLTIDSGELMNSGLTRKIVFGLFAFLSLVLPAILRAQTAFGTLRGQITDPSSAVVTDAVVLLTTPSGGSIDTTTSKEGFYEFKALAPGKYAVKVVAPGFAVFTRENVEIAAGQVQKLNIALAIEEQKQKVEVNDSPTNVNVNPDNNAGMVVLKGKDLEALSDDPDELQSDLQALAGPSAGPNGGQIYIDGFTGGTLPPKASIREIRINQNPFSAEYDKLGYGRIEIFTKPGTDQWHTDLYLSGNTSAINSRSPFEVSTNGVSLPGYDSTLFSGNVGGPLGKKASIFFNIERRDIHEISIVSAKILDPNFNVIDFTDAVPDPRTRTNLSPRLDYQIGKNNTLTVRYQYEHENQTNNGIGQFNLPSLGFNQINTEHNIQVSDTQIISAKTINETRFRFNRETSDQTPLSTAPTISVQGAFTSGGNSNGLSTDTLDRYEFQNYTSMTLGKHFLKFGIRVRDNRDVNAALSNFNGNFNFGLRQNPACPPNSPPSACPKITGIQAYGLTLQGLAQGLTLPAIIAVGGGASQYSITTGTARAEVNYIDAGPYVQDDWRIRRNVTLSFGLRFETQDNIGDHADFAPRLGLAWGIGGGGKNGAPKTVLRAGYGIFHDRFTYDLVLQQERLNGTIQQQFTFANPNFFLDTSGKAPSLSVLLSTQQPAAIAPTIYRPNPNLRTPYTMQTGLSLERQLTKYANLAVTYLTSRGAHQFFTENINPPICTAFPCDPAANPHVLGTPDNIYQYQSEGVFKQNQLIVNTSVRMGSKLSLFGYYTLNYANSDTSGAGSFPSAFNDISLDYGRASFDVRHRVFVGGTIGLPYAFRLSPLLVASSGIPFTVTTGQDLNGDSIFNDRPAFASGKSIPTNVVTNQFGSFDLVPQPGEPIVPVNSFTGSSRFSLNLRVSKSFGFGKKAEKPSTDLGGPGAGGTFGRGPGGDRRGGGPGGGGRGMGGMDAGGASHRYTLTFGVSVRNIFNNVNLDTPIGNLSSPLFGESNALARGPFSGLPGNRRLDLQMTFSF